MYPGAMDDICMVRSHLIALLYSPGGCTAESRNTSKRAETHLVPSREAMPSVASKAISTGSRLLCRKRAR